MPQLPEKPQKFKCPGCSNYLSPTMSANVLFCSDCDLDFVYDDEDRILNLWTGKFKKKNRSEFISLKDLTRSDIEWYKRQTHRVKYFNKNLKKEGSHFRRQKDAFY